MLLPETQALAKILTVDEVILGIIYGKYRQNSPEASHGRGAIIATDRRVILLDKKPLFIKCDELSYSVISGINYSKAGLSGTVTLHSRTGDISIRTFNSDCAAIFVKAIERKRFIT